LYLVNSKEEEKRKLLVSPAGQTYLAVIMH